VGRRTLGIQSFWFQAVCQNHIVWDATNVNTFSRKHTYKVHNALDEVVDRIIQLVKMRDQRRDAFARVMHNAMRAQLGTDTDAVLAKLEAHGIKRKLAETALDLARKQGAFTLYTVVDALTRLSQEAAFAGERSEIDTKASSLLALAA
jgi:hypothetical protein